MDIRLHTFLELCDTLNYRKAAEKLHITQPAVTQHIQALETSYGAKLFHYNGRILTISEAGKQLQQFARESIHREKEFLQSFQKKDQPPLRIGATRSIGTYVLQSMLPSVLKASTNSIHINVNNTKLLLNMLDHDELDFAMIEGFFDKEKYGWHLLRKERFIGICSKNHPFANHAIPFSKLFEETLILREVGSGTRDILEQVLQENNYHIDHFKRLIGINDFPLIAQLVIQNCGISFVYESVAQAYPHVDTFTIEDCTILREFNYVYLKNTRMKDKIRQFEQLNSKESEN